jgi:transcriptional/translational regulatory protein YebC/TACO1
MYIKPFLNNSSEFLKSYEIEVFLNGNQILEDIEENTVFVYNGMLSTNDGGFVIYNNGDGLHIPKHLRNRDGLITFLEVIPELNETIKCYDDSYRSKTITVKRIIDSLDSIEDIIEVTSNVDILLYYIYKIYDHNIDKLDVTDYYYKPNGLSLNPKNLILKCINKILSLNNTKNNCELLFSLASLNIYNYISNDIIINIIKKLLSDDVLMEELFIYVKYCDKKEIISLIEKCIIESEDVMIIAKAANSVPTKFDIHKLRVSIMNILNNMTDDEFYYNIL